MVEEKEKGVVFNYLAHFYAEVDVKLSEHYNLLALEHKETLTSIQKATIYSRQALSELFHDEAEKALQNIDNAIVIEPSNNYFKIIEIKILLKLNKLDGLFKKVYYLIDEFKQLNDPIQLSDAQVLLAQYWQKKDDERSALTAFKKAYELLDKSSKKVFDFKKSYLLMNISLLEGSEPKGSESLLLNNESKNYSIYRLDLIEMANALASKAGKFYDKGDYDKAIEFYDKALKIKLATLGENHPSTATSYNNIARAYYKMKKYQDSYDFMEKAVKIREMKLPSTHPNLIQSKKDLATIKEKLNAH